MPKKEREYALRQLIAECKICVQVERPKPSRKVSPIRVVAEFNQTVHIDFMFITLRDTALIMLHVLDSANVFSVAWIVSSRGLSHAASQFKENWICIHGAPASLAAYPEFARVNLKNILDNHHILFAKRPYRRHQKTGCVERKNGVLRSIIHRLALADNISPLSVIIARAILCAHTRFGNRICSSFELVRGYTPAFGSLPRSIVDSDIIQAYNERTATRAIHRNLTSKQQKGFHSALLPAGKSIWVFLKDRKWQKFQVAKAKQHFVTVRRLEKGSSMALAYEDLRIAPTQPISIASEAASLDAPELTIASDPSRPSTDIDDDESIFLSTEDRHAEEQILLRHMFKI
jgi:hypothetical protein